MRLPIQSPPVRRTALGRESQVGLTWADQSAGIQPSKTCTSSSDCFGSMVCDLARGQCTVPRKPR